MNGEYITACPHDDAVNILRNAGDLVVLTVKHYKAATPFLQKQGKCLKQLKCNFIIHLGLFLQKIKIPNRLTVIVKRKLQMRVSA